MRRPLLLAFAFLAITAVPTNAPAEHACTALEVLLERGETIGGEVPVARAVAGPDELTTVIVANPETGSWTMIFVAPDGCGFVVAYGKRWQVVAGEQPSRIRDDGSPVDLLIHAGVGRR